LLLLLKPPYIFIVAFVPVKVSTLRAGKMYLFLFFSKNACLASFVIGKHSSEYIYPLFFLDSINSAWYDLLFHSPYLRNILRMGQRLKLVLVFLWTPFNNCSFDRNTGSNLTAVGTYGELQTINWLSKNRWLSIIINLATTYYKGVIDHPSPFRPKRHYH